MPRDDGKDDQPKLSKAQKRERQKAAKKPATTVSPSGAKKPVPGPPVVDHPDSCILFGLQLMDHDGPWSWANVSPEHIQRVAAACKGFESLKVGEFMGLPGNKPIPFENLSSEAQKRLQDINLDHFDELWELRLGGKLRTWGLLHVNVFYIVWWDPEHEVCPSEKKHT